MVLSHGGTLTGHRWHSCGPLWSSKRCRGRRSEIEALAKSKLADEYDAAQKRGEVVSAHDGAKKRVPDGNAIATVTDLGLTRNYGSRGFHPWGAGLPITWSIPSMIRLCSDVPRLWAIRFSTSCRSASR